MMTDYHISLHMSRIFNITTKLTCQKCDLYAKVMSDEPVAQVDFIHPEGKRSTEYSCRYMV